LSKTSISFRSSITLVKVWIFERFQFSKCIYIYKRTFFTISPEYFSLVLILTVRKIDKNLESLLVSNYWWYNLISHQINLLAKSNIFVSIKNLIGIVHSINHKDRFFVHFSTHMLFDQHKDFFNSSSILWRDLFITFSTL